MINLEKNDNMKPLEHKQLTEPGYYWWIPFCEKDHLNVEENWSVISWHPKNEYRQKNGLFIGPLKSPAQKFSNICGEHHD